MCVWPKQLRNYTPRGLQASVRAIFRQPNKFEGPKSANLGGGMA